MPDIKYLTDEDIIFIHQLVMEQTGYTAQPLRDKGALESAIMRPQC